MELVFGKMLHRLSIDSTPSAMKYHEIALPQDRPSGTNQGDKEAEEDGECNCKFVAKSERRFSMPTPLEAGPDPEDDDEGSIEECLKHEAD